jgi:hypothetical protein
VTNMRRRFSWPPLFTFLVVFLPLVFLEGRYRVLPQWIVPVASVFGLVLVIVSIAAAWSGRDRLERGSAETLAGALILINAVSLFFLIGMLLSPVSIDGRRLLSSALSIWAGNLVMFALIYWALDRGGPVAREAGAATPTDFIFPEMTKSEYSPQRWHPNFGDYLYVSFNTSTAFSATDCPTGTTRVRILIMIQAVISLATIVIVAARAVGMVPGPT